MPFMAQMAPVVIGMEACGGAHYWARCFREHGHGVKLMTPQFVKPSVKSNKHDRAAAEAIAEAVTRPTMRFVPVKELTQQDIQALHRVRERLVKARTALIRKLFVHGARATVRWIGLKNDRRSQWLRALLQRRGTNRAVVALANKNARIAGVLLATDQVYTPEHTAA
jgi:transposase